MGFPSSAKDYEESKLSLDRLCITRPAATYFMKAGARYPSFGILADCILVIDMSRTPVEGSIVVADIDGAYGLCMMQIASYPALKGLDTMRSYKS